VKVLIVAELPSFYIPAVIKMNTVEVVLFLVPDGYVSIIFATRPGLQRRDGNGFDKTSSSEVLFQVQTSIYISLHGYFSGRQGRFDGGLLLLPGVEVRI
jgi:hypothetical protein